MTTQTQVLDQNQLISVINNSGLEKTKAQVLLDNFSSYFEMAADWERKTKNLIVDNVSQIAEMKMAREGRIFLSKKRIDVEKTRKQLKESALREGQTIDAIAKILTNLILPIENELEAKEKFKEIQEAKIKAELKASRELELQPYAEFVSFNFIDLGSMDEVNYQSLLTGARASLQNKIESEQKAEADRIAKIKAEQEEQERIKKENEKLKAEAAEKQKQLEAERVEAKKKQDALEAKAKAEAAEKQKLEDQIKAKADKEAKELQAKKLAEKKAAAAPDKDKLIQFANAIHGLNPPVLKTEEANKILENALGLLNKTGIYILENTEKL